jgi:protein-tyrosine phosphatase
MKRVLFVCLGNICRSPLAEGVFLHLVQEAGLGDRYEVDSAGTSAYHSGERADPRSRAVAERHGIDLPSRARAVRHDDYVAFDVIVAMDGENERNLRRDCPGEHQEKIRRMRAWDPEGDGDVPDPYYGGDRGFDTVYAMVERSCRSLLAELEALAG